jgi:hypothetical protein
MGNDGSGLGDIASDVEEQVASANRDGFVDLEITTSS